MTTEIITFLTPSVVDDFIDPGSSGMRLASDGPIDVAASAVANEVYSYMEPPMMGFGAEQDGATARSQAIEDVLDVLE